MEGFWFSQRRRCRNPPYRSSGRRSFLCCAFSLCLDSLASAATSVGAKPNHAFFNCQHPGRKISSGDGALDRREYRHRANHRERSDRPTRAGDAPRNERKRKKQAVFFCALVAVALRRAFPAGRGAPRRRVRRTRPADEKGSGDDTRFRRRTTPFAQELRRIPRPAEAGEGALEDFGSAPGRHPGDGGRASAVMSLCLLGRTRAMRRAPPAAGGDCRQPPRTQCSSSSSSSA